MTPGSGVGVLWCVYWTSLYCKGIYHNVSTRIKTETTEIEPTVSPPPQEEWVPLLKATDIAPGDIIPVESNGQQLLLVADFDGSVYCVANVCPHLGTPLDQGSLGDGTIVCPLHKSAFSLETGELAGDWCPFPPVLGKLSKRLGVPVSLSDFRLGRGRGWVGMGRIGVGTSAHFPPCSVS